jgi:hypothetical protein
MLAGLLAVVVGTLLGEVVARLVRVVRFAAIGSPPT